jgi:ankyrin repeat protein
MDGETPLHLADANGFIEIVKWVQKHANCSFIQYQIKLLNEDGGEDSGAEDWDDEDDDDDEAEDEEDVLPMTN